MFLLIDLSYLLNYSWYSLHATSTRLGYDNLSYVFTAIDDMLTRYNPDDYVLVLSEQARSTQLRAELEFLLVGLGFNLISTRQRADALASLALAQQAQGKKVVIVTDDEFMVALAGTKIGMGQVALGSSSADFSKQAWAAGAVEDKAENQAGATLQSNRLLQSTSFLQANPREQTHPLTIYNYFYQQEVSGARHPYKHSLTRLLDYRLLAQARESLPLDSSPQKLDKLWQELVAGSSCPEQVNLSLGTILPELVAQARENWGLATGSASARKVTDLPLNELELARLSQAYQELCLRQQQILAAARAAKVIGALAPIRLGSLGVELVGSLVRYQHLVEVAERLRTANYRFLSANLTASALATTEAKLLVPAWQQAANYPALAVSQPALAQAITKPTSFKTLVSKLQKHAHATKQERLLELLAQLAPVGRACTLPAYKGYQSPRAWLEAKLRDWYSKLQKSAKSSSTKHKTQDAGRQNLSRAGVENTNTHNAGLDSASLDNASFDNASPSFSALVVQAYLANASVFSVHWQDGYSSSASALGWSLNDVRNFLNSTEQEFHGLFYERPGPFVSQACVLKPARAISRLYKPGNVSSRREEFWRLCVGERVETPLRNSKAMAFLSAQTITSNYFIADSADYAKVEQEVEKLTNPLTSSFVRKSANPLSINFQSTNFHTTNFQPTNFQPTNLQTPHLEQPASSQQQDQGLQPQQPDLRWLADPLPVFWSDKDGLPGARVLKAKEYSDEPKSSIQLQTLATRLPTATRITISLDQKLYVAVDQALRNYDYLAGTYHYFADLTEKVVETTQVRTNQVVTTKQDSARQNPAQTLPSAQQAAITEQTATAEQSRCLNLQDLPKLAAADLGWCDLEHLQALGLADDPLFWQAFLPDWHHPSWFTSALLAPKKVANTNFLDLTKLSPLGAVEQLGTEYPELACWQVDQLTKLLARNQLSLGSRPWRSWATRNELVSLPAQTNAQCRPQLASLREQLKDQAYSRLACKDSLSQVTPEASLAPTDLHQPDAALSNFLTQLDADHQVPESTQLLTTAGVEVFSFSGIQISQALELLTRVYPQALALPDWLAWVQACQLGQASPEQSYKLLLVTNPDAFFSQQAESSRAAGSYGAQYLLDSPWQDFRALVSPSPLAWATGDDYLSKIRNWLFSRKEELKLDLLSDKLPAEQWSEQGGAQAAKVADRTQDQLAQAAGKLAKTADKLAEAADEKAVLDLQLAGWLLDWWGVGVTSGIGVNPWFYQDFYRQFQAKLKLEPNFTTKLTNYIAQQKQELHQKILASCGLSEKQLSQAYLQVIGASNELKSLTKLDTYRQKRYVKTGLAGLPSLTQVLERLMHPELDVKPGYLPYLLSVGKKHLVSQTSQASFPNNAPQKNQASCGLTNPSLVTWLKSQLQPELDLLDQALGNFAKYEVISSLDWEYFAEKVALVKQLNLNWSSFSEFDLNGYVSSLFQPQPATPTLAPSQTKASIPAPISYFETPQEAEVVLAQHPLLQKNHLLQENLPAASWHQLQAAQDPTTYYQLYLEPELTADLVFGVARVGDAKYGQFLQQVEQELAVLEHLQALPPPPKPGKLTLSQLAEVFGDAEFGKQVQQLLELGWLDPVTAEQAKPDQGELLEPDDQTLQEPTASPEQTLGQQVLFSGYQLEDSFAEKYQDYREQVAQCYQRARRYQALTKRLQTKSLADLRQDELGSDWTLMLNPHPAAQLVLQFRKLCQYEQALRQELVHWLDWEKVQAKMANLWGEFGYASGGGEPVCWLEATSTKASAKSPTSPAGVTTAVTALAPNPISSSYGLPSSVLSYPRFSSLDLTQESIFASNVDVGTIAVDLVAEYRHSYQARSLFRLQAGAQQLLSLSFDSWLAALASFDQGLQADYQAGINVFLVVLLRAYRFSQPSPDYGAILQQLQQQGSFKFRQALVDKRAAKLQAALGKSSAIAKAAAKAAQTGQTVEVTLADLVAFERGVRLYLQGASDKQISQASSLVADLAFFKTCLQAFVDCYPGTAEVFATKLADNYLVQDWDSALDLLPLVANSNELKAIAATKVFNLKRQQGKFFEYFAELGLEDGEFAAKLDAYKSEEAEFVKADGEDFGDEDFGEDNFADELDEDEFGEDYADLDFDDEDDEEDASYFDDEEDDEEDDYEDEVDDDDDEEDDEDFDFANLASPSQLDELESTMLLAPEQAATSQTSPSASKLAAPSALIPASVVRHNAHTSARLHYRTGEYVESGVLSELEQLLMQPQEQRVIDATGLFGALPLLNWQASVPYPALAQQWTYQSPFPANCVSSTAYHRLHLLNRTANLRKRRARMLQDLFTRLTQLGLSITLVLPDEIVCAVSNEVLANLGSLYQALQDEQWVLSCHVGNHLGQI